MKTDAKVTFRAEAQTIGHYDIVVAGGGPAGVAASVVSSRAGMKTLLVESKGCLGGVATSAGVAVWLGGGKKGKTPCKWAVGGIFREIYDVLLENGWASEFGSDMGVLGAMGGDHIYFDMEHLKRVLDGFVTSAGVDLLYFTTALSLKIKENKIEGLYLVNKSGLNFVEARMVIDCTGDADIAHRAGFETVKGRSDTGLMTAATLMSWAEDVDSEEIEAYFKTGKDRRFRRLVQELRTKGIWNYKEETIIVLPTTRKNVYMINTSRLVGVDGTDASSLTRAMIEGRRNAHEFLEKILKQYYPGFKNATLRWTAPVVGIRETRKIVGEYTLTDTDCIEGVQFKDTIALTGYGFDLPDPEKPSYQPYRDVSIKGGYVSIPYRCLVPIGSENLLVAGRCISVKDMALGPVRDMPPCYAMGHAAGIAASMCLEAPCKPRSLDVTELRRRLLEQRAILE